MQFEITKEFIQHLQFLIEIKDNEQILADLQNVHPADIADILERLTNEEARYIFFQLSPSVAAATLVELEDDKIDRFLEVIPGEIIASELIDKMDSDDAADILQSLPNRIKSEILANITDSEHASSIANLLDYDENSAGGLMATELLRVNINWDVKTCISEIRRQSEEIENAVYVYVVNDKNILLGTLSITQLILNHEKVKIQDIYETNPIAVHTNTPSEEVANIMDKYDLFVLPVIDSLNRLKGRITIDDVVDVIREEAEKDYQMISGISQDIESTDSIFRQTKARLPWLLIGLLGGIFGSQIIGNFEADIQKYSGLALFLPLLAAMGGNVGVQSSSIVVQGIANGSIGIETITPKILKELLGGALNGLICSSILLFYNVLFGHGFALTISVSIALFSIIIFASVFGTFVPLILHRFKIDPALATGPFITTINDIMGGLIYFSIARLIFAHAAFL